MQYSLRIEIDYDFPRPTGGGRQILRILPQENADQILHSKQLTITPRPIEHSSFTDFFGTQVLEMVLPSGIRKFKVVLQAEVLCKAPQPPQRQSPKLQDLPNLIQAQADMGPQSPHHYTMPSPHIPAVAQIAAFATKASQSCNSVKDVIEAVGRALHAHMTFDAEATDVQTPISQSFAARRGVCQDYSQIMICALRSLGIPAAYSAGYLRTLPPEGQPRLQGADAMHAWVRAWAGPDLGWLSYDPTNICWVQTDHILVGYGRDYADAAPVTGSLILEGEQSGRHNVDIIAL